MNILITGASGFIGSNLVRVLRKKDVNLYLIKRNMPRQIDNISIIQADLSKEGFTEKFPKNIDVVIHLAQSTKYRDFPNEVANIFSINISSTQELLEWSRNSGVKKFIFASTGNVYKQQDKLLSEDDTCEPNSYYGASKFAAEQLVKSYNGLFDTYILRLFGVYGEGQQSMTIPNIIDRIKNSQELLLAKGVGLYFTPLHIEDCVPMLISTIFDNQNKTGVYNLAGSEKVSLSRVIDILSVFLATKPNVIITNNKPAYLMGNSNLFIKTFTFTPKIKVEEGLKRTINKNLKNE